MDKEKIKESIAQGKIEHALDKVIQEIANINDDGIKNDFILQSSKLKRILREKSLGIQSTDTTSLNINQITIGVLSMIDDIEAAREDEKFKSQVFEGEETTSELGLIPVFFSIGTPHNIQQLEYIKELKSHLKKYNIDLITLENDDWNTLDPLDPIRKKMIKCAGSLVLAMERYHVKVGRSKRGSEQESKIENQNYATSWAHIEAAMAYLLDHPLIILKEDSLRSEGMLDDELFEWRIIKINTKNPKELGEYPLKQFIRMWVEEIKKNARSTNERQR